MNESSDNVIHVYRNGNQLTREPYFHVRYAEPMGPPKSSYKVKVGELYLNFPFELCLNFPFSEGSQVMMRFALPFPFNFMTGIHKVRLCEDGVFRQALGNKDE